MLLCPFSVNSNKMLYVYRANIICINVVVIKISLSLSWRYNLSGLVFTSTRVKSICALTSFTTVIARRAFHCSTLRNLRGNNVAIVAVTNIAIYHHCLCYNCYPYKRRQSNTDYAVFATIDLTDLIVTLTLASHRQCQQNAMIPLTNPSPADNIPARHRHCAALSASSATTQALISACDVDRRQ